VVDILDISPIIPNDAVSFGSQFPEDLRLQIETALLELADPVGEVWDDSIGKLYEWEGINRAADDGWDWLRTVLEAAEFSIDDQ
jgi:ABC-type phosphate/phosphonate transport system substrate-binding protein